MADFFLKILASYKKQKMEENPEMKRGGKEGKRRGLKKELRYIMYIYQLPTINVIIGYCEHVLTKIKILKT